MGKPMPITVANHLKCLKFTLTDCTPIFGIRVHTDGVADYGKGSAAAPTDTISGACLDFTHIPCNQR